MESLKKFTQSFMDWVGRMSASQVMMLLGIVAGSVVGLIFMVGWLNSVTYARLYSNLSQNEAGEIVSHLNDQKVPYQITDGGSSIEVPSDKVYQVRLELAGQGLPTSGSVGYSIFDENNLGMTDFLQNLNFRRALEGELTRTIMQLSEVQAARVHIVMPKERLFREDQREATASVVLKLSGVGLAKAQVKGITHLVASSVEGLSPEKITIVDYDGNLLSSGDQADMLAGLSSSQLEVRQNVERYLEDKAQSMLDNVLGTDKSVVRVTADLNFRQVERQNELYDPNSATIRSEQRTQADSKVEDKETEEAESSSQENNETVITNYEINKTVEHIVNAVGTIDRLSVAVLVDGTYEEVESDDGALETIYQPRPQDELDRLASIVQNAVGFNRDRDDQLEMVNIAFDRQDLQEDREALDSMYMRDFYMEIARKVGYVLLIIILLLYFRKKARKLFSSLGQLMVPRPEPQPEPVAPAPESKEPEPEPEDLAIKDNERENRLVDQIRETARKQPDEMAKVIRTLMID
jgi:flagellar M-ring protein FliF